MLEKNYQYILSNVIPYLINKFEVKYPQKFKHSPIRHMLLTLKSEGRLEAIIDYGGFCKYGKKGVVKTFRYFSYSETLKKPPQEIDCCGFSRITDSDIPHNWKEIIELKILKSHSLRAK